MKGHWVGIGLVAMIILIGFFVFSGLDGTTPDVVINDSDAQEIVLSQDGLNYANVVAQEDKPILISADSSVRGCLRSVAFVVDKKRYVKYLETPSDTLLLPALNKGTYTFSCSMGMGFGRLIVE